MAGPQVRESEVGLAEAGGVGGLNLVGQIRLSEEVVLVFGIVP